jgi:hypothetical protein
VLPFDRTCVFIPRPTESGCGTRCNIRFSSFLSWIAWKEEALQVEGKRKGCPRDRDGNAVLSSHQWGALYLRLLNLFRTPSGRIFRMADMDVDTPAPSKKDGKQRFEVKKV